jgi:hypothetical protein
MGSMGSMGSMASWSFNEDEESDGEEQGSAGLAAATAAGLAPPHHARHGHHSHSPSQNHGHGHGHSHSHGHGHGHGEGHIHGPGHGHARVSPSGAPGNVLQQPPPAVAAWSLAVAAAGASGSMPVAGPPGPHPREPPEMTAPHGQHHLPLQPPPQHQAHPLAPTPWVSGGEGATLHLGGRVRPTVIGAHPITVLPAFGVAEPIAGAAHAGRAAAAQPHHAPRPSSPPGSSSSGGSGGAAGRRRGEPRSAGRARPALRPPHFSHLVFGGGGARTLAYAGAVHALRTLGLVRRVESVAGASGGAILAVLSALGLGPGEVLAAMGGLPDAEGLSWMGLNRNLGLASGAELFGAIEQVRAGLGRGRASAWRAQDLRQAPVAV